MVGYYKKGCYKTVRFCNSPLSIDLFIVTDGMNLGKMPAPAWL